VNHWWYVVTLIFLLSLTPPAVAQDIFEQETGLFTTNEMTIARECPDTDSIVILSASELSGALEVKAADIKRIEVVYTKKAKTGSRSQAIDYIDLLSVSLDSRPSHARLELRAPNPSPWTKAGESAWIDAVVTVPMGWAVRIEAPYYDVTANGPFSGLVIPSSLGRLDVKHVTGEVDVTTANRRVNLEDVSGTISVTTSNSTLVARQIESLGEPAKFVNDGGDIDISGVVGAVTVRNRFGRITVSDFEPRGRSSRIHGEQAPIAVEIRKMTEGQLVISNRNEDIDITIPDSLSSFLSLAVDDNGVIEATGFQFTTDLVQPNRLNLITGDGTVTISSTIRGEGNIYVRGAEGE
jgi:hypothetical protein